jgi:hypothetical protein
MTVGRRRPHGKCGRDSNHSKVKKRLDKLPFLAVHSTADSPGFCDIVLGYQKQNHMFEIKPEGWSGPRNDKERNQARWRQLWGMYGGPVHVVTTFEEVLEVLGIEINKTRTKPDKGVVSVTRKEAP